MIEYCLQGAENCTNCSSYQLLQLMNLNRTYGHNFFELSRTLMRKNVNNDVSKDSPIRHLHISHNTPYLPPKFCTTFVFNFSYVVQPSQEKMKTMLMQNLEVGGRGANKVHYGRCASGV